MPARKILVVARPSGRAWLCSWALCCALFSSGCANCRLPRIDPSGDRLFVPANAPPVVRAPVIAAPPPGAALLVPGQWGVSVSPSQVIAPVGTEVVMIASVCGSEGFMMTNQRVEWTLAPDGAGHFMSPGERPPLEILQRLHGLPNKVDSRYVINTTLAAPMTLDRGTPTLADDVLVQSGQSWVTVTSPTEGTSRVTVFAPGVQGWDRRQQTASIYWVDAQWRFPSPSIHPVGSRSALVTQLTRQSDNSPLSGWHVRYEIASGPDAGFSPDGASSLEVASNDAGEAAVEIFQKQPSAGTNQINIQVIRPPGVGGQNRSVPVGSGSTLQTWTSADTTIRVAGPAQTSVGATVTYRLDVFNPADSPVQGIVVADQPPPGLTFESSNPPGTAAAIGHEWRIDELPAKGKSTVEVNYRVVEGGNFNYCATVSSGNGTSSRTCMTTVAAAAVIPATPAPAQLEVTVIGPRDATVGTDAQFEIQVSNRGASPATGLVVTDRFDAGLQHAVASSPIEKSLVDLQPGSMARFAVTFRVMQAGELCQDVEVNGDGGLRASARNCLSATPAAEPPTTTMPPEREPAAVEPTPVQPEPSTATERPLSVRKTGPTRRRVGELARFTIEVTNNSAQPVNQVEIADNFETSLDPKQATDGYERLRGNALGWKVASIGPGKTIRREIEFACIQETPRACNRVTITAEGMEPLADEACLEIVGLQQPAAAPPAAPEPPMLSVSVAETADPIKVGGETTYQVLVANKGSQPIYDVAVVVTFGDELKLQSFGSPEKATVLPGTVRFNVIRELRAGEAPLNYELRMSGARAGTARVRVEATSRGQVRAVSAEQDTEILP